MDREEFNKLTVDKQVEEFNKLYLIDGSIKNVALKLGISKNTISSRFKSAGYVVTANGYIKNTNISIKQETLLIEAPRECKTDIQELEQLVNRLIDKRFKKTPNDIELSSMCEGHIKYRSMGYYEDIGEKFIEYCKGKKRYTQIEILSQAMHEFMENHP